MFHILRGVKDVRGTDKVSVLVSVENDKEKLLNGSTRLQIERTAYQRARELTRAVLTAEVDDDRNNDPTIYAMGTGFHVGGNLVLTNRHVLSPNQSNWSRCGDLRFKSYDGKKFSCKKVVYCEPNPGCPASTTGCQRTPDICLIEVSGNLAKYPSVTLSSETLLPSNDAFSTIGNSGGFGLHFSESLGLRRVSDWNLGIKTQAYHGNSGGPLYNADNEVVGVLYKRNRKIETFAVGMDWTLNRLKEKLGEDSSAWKTIQTNIR